MKSYSVMSAQEYAALEPEVPYLFSLKKGDKQLCYFGSAHMRDPKNPGFSQIREQFQTFKPDMVFVEGMTNLQGPNKEHFKKQSQNTSEKDLIQKYGESGFTLKLAVDAGIDFESPEPSDFQAIQSLLEQGFKKEDIFAYFLYSAIEQYHRQDNTPANKESLETVLQKEINAFEEQSHWPDFEYSLSHLQAIGTKIWGTKGDIHHPNQEDREQWIDPIAWKNKKDQWTIINDISQQHNLFRDQYIVGKIEEALKTHKRLFVVYGASHAVMQEPALQKMFL